MSGLIASRILWLDAVRGVGIGFVILGHMAFSPPVMCLIYAFHIPLFFIVAGYLFPSAKSPGEIIWAKTKGLLIPYYIFSAVMILLLLCFSGDKAPVCLDGRTCKEALWPTVLGTLPVIEASWFLPCLFATSVAGISIRKLIGWKRPLIVLAALLILAQVWSFFRWPGLPFRLHNVPFGLAFLLIGMLWRKYFCWERMRRLQLIVASGLSILIFIPVALLHGRVDMNSNLLGCAPIYFITGSLGTAAVIFACQTIESLKPILLEPLAYMGRRSLLILVAHEAVAATVHAQLGEWGTSHFRVDRVATLIFLLAVVEGLHGANGLCRRILVLVQEHTQRMSLGSRS